MATPDFVLRLRERIGHEELWLIGTTAVIVRDEREVLLVRRSDTGDWTPVTGIVDPGEEAADAAAREALEEAGVIIRVDRLARLGVTALYEYPNGDRSRYTDVTFRCTWLSGEPYPADGENTDAAWFGLDALPPMSAHMLGRIEAALADDPRAVFRRLDTPEGAAGGHVAGEPAGW
ncbi:NUDIX domain-containing protein [Galbitalea sp. SE-J8]|uniref:NUDIX hydrolase n=1 Tax=Galbitalea sp. SE-J8 TaxID=3054952 RepID=UPI00259CA9FC|nr:NUDIX domain-containing protein [Galbitalea sp. SE-J8]MDM4761807.1 NUDIX domain-containing protein [Galbitalea sp. SE-J8]